MLISTHLIAVGAKLISNDAGCSLLSERINLEAYGFRAAGVNMFKELSMEVIADAHLVVFKHRRGVIVKPVN